MAGLAIGVLQALEVALQCQLKFASGQLRRTQCSVMLPQRKGVARTLCKGSGFFQLEDGTGMLCGHHHVGGIKAHSQRLPHVVRFGLGLC